MRSAPMRLEELHLLGLARKNISLTILIASKKLSLIPWFRNLCPIFLMYLTCKLLEKLTATPKLFESNWKACESISARCLIPSDGR